MTLARFLNYPSGIGHNTENNPGWIEFTIYERKSPKNSVPKATINLYLPEKMTSPNTVSWGNDSLGMLGQGVNQFFNGGGVSSNKEGWVDSLTRVGIGMAASAGSAAVSAGGGSVSADTLIGVATGKLRNPFLAAVFKGVDFRTFEMGFKFCPYKEKDCDTIDQIIKHFRGSSVPAGKGADNASMLGYPDEFEIRYIWQGKENKYLHKFKRCVLTGIDVDYTGMGMWAAMRNGFPAESNISLRFTETELVLRDDIQTGNY